MADRTAGELAFIDQRTRQLLVQWAENCIRNSAGIPDLGSAPSREEMDSWARDADSGAIHPFLLECRRLEMHRLYFDHALSKGWIGKKVVDGRRKLTASGWKTAASFLKR